MFSLNTNSFSKKESQVSGDFDRHTSFQMVINEISLLTFQGIRSTKVIIFK
jgi:hypothetical protein